VESAARAEDQIRAMPPSPPPTLRRAARHGPRPPARAPDTLVVQAAALSLRLRSVQAVRGLANAARTKSNSIRVRANCVRFSVFMTFRSSRRTVLSRDAGKSFVTSIAFAIYSRKPNACSIRNSACSSPLLLCKVKSTYSWTGFTLVSPLVSFRGR
jgi:hypothetical protein